MSFRSDMRKVLAGLQIDVGDAQIFFVSSTATNASDSNDGRTKDYPLATLDGVFNHSQVAAGDIAVLLDTHAETYSTTGVKLTADVQGIRIVSVGTGSKRATFTFSHTGATFTISANGIKFYNCLFVAGVDSVVTFGTVSGDDCEFIDCEDRDATDVEVITDWTVTGDRLKVKRHFKNGYLSGDANVRVFLLNAAHFALFEDCRFMTKVTTAVIGMATTACQGVLAKGCLFYVNGTALSKNVVETGVSGTWAAQNCFDLTSGAEFSGGSGNSLAADDLSAVTDALYGANGIATFPAAAAPANNVSIAEVLGWINDALQGANGVVTFPAAAAPANGVSMAEVLRAVYDRQIGNATTCGENVRLGTRVTKATADTITGTATSIFTVATGRVLLTAIYGKVTTIIGAGTTNQKLQFNPTTGTTVDMCANLDIDADEAGSLYSITGVPGDAMLTSQSGAVRNLANAGGIVLDIGDIEVVTDQNRTGSIQWTAWYIPLDDGATLAAA